MRNRAAIIAGSPAGTNAVVFSKVTGRDNAEGKSGCYFDIGWVVGRRFFPIRSFRKPNQVPQKRVCLSDIFKPDGN